MTMSEEQIQKLLEWFVKSSQTIKRSEDRKKAYAENHKWIQSAAIQKMPDTELETKFLEYFNSGGGKQRLNPIYRDRIIRNKKHFREERLEYALKLMPNVSLFLYEVSHLMLRKSFKAMLGGLFALLCKAPTFTGAYNK